MKKFDTDIGDIRDALRPPLSWHLLTWLFLLFSFFSFRGTYPFQKLYFCLNLFKADRITWLSFPNQKISVPPDPLCCAIPTASGYVKIRGPISWYYGMFPVRPSYFGWGSAYLVAIEPLLPAYFLQHLKIKFGSLARCSRLVALWNIKNSKTWI